MKKTINWGIIGCGDVTEVKSGPAFNKVEKSKLVAVMRRNESLAADYASRHGVPKWYADGDALINDPDVDAIYVATPPSSHAYYASKAMQAGKPVYVEKPMAANYAQCMEMVEVSKETGVPLFVAYYRRTLPGFLKVKELVDEGVIGTPLFVNIRLIRPPLPVEIDDSQPSWRVDPETAGGGIFFDLASHQFDFLDFVFGPVTEVTGIAANRGGLYKAEDTVAAVLRFNSGVVASGTWSFVSGPETNEDVVEIVGSKGRIVFSSFGHQPIQLITKNGTVEFPYMNPENIQYNLIRQVVESLQSKKECVSTGISAARTNWVMEQVVKGFYEF
jgi:predicted dehydrogenase